MTNYYKTITGILVITFFTAIIFLPRLATLPYRGEEPRRVVSSYELLQSGNWFVPTIQNEVFLSRPPLQNWVIAATGMIRGNFDHLTGRLPSVLCVLLTALLIYYYSLAALSHNTALLASLFFLTMPQVIQLGRTAETELMFTLFLSASFLLWHRGEMSNWSNTWKWTVAYFLLACATLTKGINQAPVYFAAIIGMHLLWNRRLNTLLSTGHLIGLGLFCLIVGFWQWGFMHYVGAKTGLMMHMGDVALRFNDTGLKKYINHAITFPVELFAVMLPWSILLPVYLSRSFWLKRLPPEAKPIAVFCISAIAITFLSVWIPPGAQTRYYMPLFPCFAILAAMVATAACRPLQDNEKVNALLQQPDLLFPKILILLIPMAGVITFIWALIGRYWIVPPEPLSNAVVYLCGTVVLSLCLIIILHKKTANKLYLSVICYALFAALTVSLVYTDTRKIVYNDVESQVLRGLNKLPKGTNLVSIGPIAFDFLYYYMLHTGKTIPIMTDEAPGTDYLCADSRITLPLPWKKISEIETGRYKKEYTNRPVEKVIIAKKM